MANHDKKRQFSRNRCSCKWWKMMPITRNNKLPPGDKKKLGLPMGKGDY